MSKKLFRSGLIVSFMTLISRVLGLIRDIIIADKIGAGAGADVFFFANRIPNFLRKLFAEGAFAQAFVPVLSEVKEQHGDDEVRLLLARTSGTLGVVVSLVTLIAVIASPVIAALFGMGWFVDWMNGGPNAEKFELASFMLKITFPYLWFITFVALSGAVLNTYNRFAVAAFTPVFLNIAMIGSAIWLSDSFDNPALSLAVGVFLGGLIQFLFQLPFLAKAGLLVLPRWGWRDEKVTKIRTLMLPAIFGVSVNQINMLLDAVIASFLITGSISWLYYADRLIEFPLGLFGIGIATVILPTLSKLHVNGEGQQFQQTMSWALKFIVTMGLPALAGLMVLSKPIISVLYFRGEFSTVDAQNVSWALIAYSCGLISFMSIKVLAPGYYARQDTKTPVKIGIRAMVANMVFNLILAPWLGFVGLALATAMSASLNAFWLYQGLKREGHFELDNKTLGYFARVGVATVAMALTMFYFSPPFEQWIAWPILERCLMLAGYISIGVIVYAVALLLNGITINDLKNKA